MPEIDSPIRASFRKPFAEQLAAFRLRLGDLVPTAKWDDIEKAQHDRAFMVAGATKADLLADLGVAVDKAIAEGTGLEAFRKDFRKIVEKHGWHGWTGEGTAKGEAWRTRVIYRTNLRTTYMAGRHAQLVAGNYPFWVYRHGGSLEPRIQHLLWDGLILESDHPFWATHFPPNGWGCSCRVFGARSREAARRKGGDPGKVLEDGWQSIDPKTGAPKGLDKGWDYAPGASVAQTIAELAPKLDKLPPRPSTDLIQEWLSSELFEAWHARPTGFWPVARVAADQAASIGQGSQVAKVTADRVRDRMRLAQGIRPSDFTLIQKVISNATRITRDGDDALVYVLEGGAETYLVRVIRVGDELQVTEFRRGV